VLKSKPSDRLFLPRGVDRDDFGRPRNRAKTWGTKTQDPKSSRRDWRREMRREYGFG